MPGPAPKPSNLKRLQGNPGHRALNAQEPTPEPDSGYCPKHLSRQARAEWRRVVPALRELGLLTVVDRAALEAYCESYATWRQAQDVLDRNGLTYATPKGEPRRRPEVTIAANALKLLRAFASEFGMTPGARTRVKAPIKEPADPFAEFIKASGVTNALDE